MMFIATFIVLFLMIVIIVIEIQSKKAGIIPAPTFSKTRNYMIDMLPDNPDGDILELGCGWGSSLLALAKRYPNHTVIGYEMTTLPYWMSRFRVALSRRKNITLLQKDFMAESFENAGAIFCYLSFRHMETLEPKFMAELKNTAVVVSHSFPLPSIPATKTEIIKEGFWLSTIYLYKTDEHREEQE